MIKILYEKINLPVTVLALLTACAIGVLISQLNVVSQVFVLLVLVSIAIIAAFSVFHISIDPAWVFVLVIFFELVGFVVGFFRPGSLLIWLLVALPFPFVVVTLIRQPGHIIPSFKELWPWLLLVGFAFMSAAWSLDSTYGLTKITILLLRGLIPGIYILLLCKINGNFSWRTVLIISIVYSIVILLFGQELPEYPGRIVLSGGNPILVARVCFLGAMVALWYTDGSKLLRLVALVLSIIVALKTQSRGPLIAFLAANTFTISIKYFADVIWGRLTWKKISMYGLILASVIGVILFATVPDPEPDFGMRYNALTNGHNLTNDENFSSRLDLYQKAGNMFLNNPLIGVGLGGFAQSGHPYPHNIILEIAAEMGLIGIFLWGLAVFKALIKASNNYLVLSLLIQSIFFAFFTANFGNNFEYILISMIALGLTAKP